MEQKLLEDSGLDFHIEHYDFGKTLLKKFQIMME